MKKKSSQISKFLLNDKLVGMPNSIKIGSHTIPVHYYKSETEAVSLANDKGLFDDGQLFGVFISFPIPKILIDGRFESNPNHPTMTLLHECLEAISELYGLELTEQDIRCLELALHGLLKDNPKFFHALKKSVEG
jgi:hypothetical protein